jgi:3-hydroxy-5-methyl-1-naphthoate 3-O-methyltransferase
VLDFFKDNLPTGHDVALLSHIIHFLDEEKDNMLLKKIYDSLPNDRNGAIIISEWLLNDEKSGPIPSALMSLTMIVDQPQGRIYKSFRSLKDAYRCRIYKYREKAFSWTGGD